MKNAFFDALCDLAAENPDIEFIRADVGFNARYNKNHPKQCLNIGICEQNMIGVAGGMALEGKTVFTYSLVDFTTYRNLDQIRVVAGYNKANIKVVTCGTGFDYCVDGVSHVSVDNLNVMLNIQNLTIFSPCDPVETYAITVAAAKIKGPCFIMIGIGGEPNLHKAPITDYEAGQVLPLRSVSLHEPPGSDIQIFVTGSIAGEVITAADNLAKNGIDVGVYSFPTIKPLNEAFIKEAASKASLIVTVEEHLLPGGFGSAVAEVLAEMPGRKAKFKRIGVPEGWCDNPEINNEKRLLELYNKCEAPAYLRKYAGLTAPSLEKTIKGLID